MILEPWGRTTYQEALEAQASLTREGRVGWLLFSCPPTITVGRRAKSTDFVVPRALCAERGVTVLDVDRGGELTFHGPQQIIGFPFGRLEDHVGDSRGVRVFVARLKQAIENVVSRYATVSEGDDCREVGVWAKVDALDAPRKVASIGLGFSREGMRHGFALNVLDLPRSGFELINPCGMPSQAIGTLGLGRVDGVRSALLIALSDGLRQEHAHAG